MVISQDHRLFLNEEFVATLTLDQEEETKDFWGILSGATSLFSTFVSHEFGGHLASWMWQQDQRQHLVACGKESYQVNMGTSCILKIPFLNF